MAFQCWKCGACCRFIGFKAPELDRGDRACINLKDDNTCAIYEDRPDICRLDPNRPEEEQEAWCKLMESNWRTYVRSLDQGLTRGSGCGILPGNENGMG